MSEEKATEEEKEKEEKAAGAELKTKTQHSDVGKTTAVVRWWHLTPHTLRLADVVATLCTFDITEIACASLLYACLRKSCTC